MSINKFDQVNEDGNRWSSLPNLLLWMIKARLDYPNSIRFASVCKHWLHASVSCPYLRDEYEVDNSPPWIMLYKDDEVDNKREFVNLLTQERYTISDPDFSGSKVLYSKQGWLLLVRLRHRKSGMRTGSVDTNYDSPYLLFNPFKNVKIKLPFLDDYLNLGAFSIKHGNPDYIILGSTCGSSYDSLNMVLYVTHQGDNNKAWLRFSYTCAKDNCEGARWIFIINNLVCFITDRARVVVFDITNLHWCEYSRKLSKRWYLMFIGEQYMVERKGELIFLHFLEGVSDMQKDCDKATFYKLNLGEKVYWELMDGHVLSQRCLWFLTEESFNCSFVCETDEVEALAKFGKFVNNTWVQFKSSKDLKLVHMC